jgi:hypothetical protein
MTGDPQIKHLEFGCNYELFEKLPRSFAIIQTLESNNSAITQILESNNALESLCIMGCEIDRASGSAIGDILHKHNSLKSLTFQLVYNCPDTDSGITEILSRYDRLINLELSVCTIVFDEWVAIFQILGKSTCLKTLNLTNNIMGTSFVEVLHHKTITSLTVDYLDSISTEDYTTIAEILKKNTTLRKLSLVNHENFELRDAICLGEMLQQNNTIEYLNFSYKSAKSQDWIDFAKVLQTNTSKPLKLSNDVDKECIEHVYRSDHVYLTVIRTKHNIYLNVVTK